MMRILRLLRLSVVAVLVLATITAAQLPDPPRGEWNTAEGMPDLSKLTFEKTPTGLLIAKVRLGEQMMSPPLGSTAIVHYNGYLLDGRKFDSSLSRGKPIEFTVGAGQVIKGWDEAVGQMQRGAKWVLVIPPDLAYGKRGISRSKPPIPPNAWLVFEVLLQGYK
ncbi:MAG: FKBP-type peptidyl-prolyl cis-trans isomerase [bacterium]